MGLGERGFSTLSSSSNTMPCCMRGSVSALFRGVARMEVGCGGASAAKFEGVLSSLDRTTFGVRLSENAVKNGGKSRLWRGAPAPSKLSISL